MSERVSIARKRERERERAGEVLTTENVPQLMVETVQHPAYIAKPLPLALVPLARGPAGGGDGGGGGASAAVWGVCVCV